MPFAPGVFGLGGDLLRPADGVKGDGEPDRMSSCDRDEIELTIGSRPSRLPSRGPKKPEPTRLGKNGVCVPDALGRAEGGCSASREACRRRFVVPRAFVWLERAEQTSATLELGMYDLALATPHLGEAVTYSTMRVMLSRDLPTLVPPYFWMIHGTLSSDGLRSSTSS